jgi:bifunctional non-homologous end joining protein LigD
MFPDVKPMELSRRAEAFDHSDWIFELKHDGFRAIAYVAKGECKLVSRKNIVYKSFVPLQQSITNELQAKNAILDGEIVCLDSDGRSIFNELLYRRVQPFFYAFDLIWFNGKDLRQLPLIERKRMLRRLVPQRRHGRVKFAHHIKGRGRALFRKICKMDLEGIVAKHGGGLYLPDTKWIKIKNPNYSQAQGRRELFEKRRRVPLGVVADKSSSNKRYLAKVESKRTK